MLFIIEVAIDIIVIKEVFMEEVAFELGFHFKKTKQKHILTICQELGIQR